MAPVQAPTDGVSAALTIKAIGEELQNPLWGSIAGGLLCCLCGGSIYFCCCSGDQLPDVDLQNKLKKHASGSQLEMIGEVEGHHYGTRTGDTRLSLEHQTSDHSTATPMNDMDTHRTPAFTQGLTDDPLGFGMDQKSVRMQRARITGIPLGLIKNAEFLRSLEDLIKQMLENFEIVGYEIVKMGENEYHVLIDLNQGISEMDCHDVTSQLKEQLAQYGNDPSVRNSDLGEQVRQCAKKISMAVSKMGAGLAD